MAIVAGNKAIAGNTTLTVVLSFCVAIAEGFDIQAIGVAAPRLGPELGLTPEALGWVFSISNIGLVIGAIVGGWLSDRVGRKPVFVGAVALFGVFTLATAVSRTFPELFAIRFLAGLNFGAALPIMMAVASELSSPGKRAQAAATVFCGMPLGGGLSALLTQASVDLDWRP